MHWSFLRFADLTTRDLYALLRLIPSTRDSARRLGLVTRSAMVSALVRAVEQPPSAGARIVAVAEIKDAAL